MRQDPMTASILDAWEATFPKNPLGHAVTGNPETIDKLTPKMLEKFDAETKEKAPLVIAVVAPQEENELTRYATSAFGNVKTTAHVQGVNVEPTGDFNVLTRTLNVKQTTFSLGVATRGITSSEYPALLCIEDHLGSERHYSGVLFKELREKRGLTYFAHSKLSALRDCGLLTSYAGAEHEKVAESIGLMLKCMAEIRDKSFPEKQLQELKTFHRQAVGVTLEVPYQAAMWLATNAFRGGKVDFESYMSDLEAVSSETIRSVARQCFTPSRMALSVAGKPPDDETLRGIMRRELE
jgi:zinc protease